MSARSRRMANAVGAGVLAVAAVVAVVSANILATRYNARVPIGSAAEKPLSERTTRILSRAPEGTEILLALDARGADRAAIARVRDVLSDMDRAAAGVRFTEIDTGTSRGVRDTEATLTRLAERDAEDISAYVRTLDGIATRADGLAGTLEGLTAPLGLVRDAIPADAPGAAQNRAYFDQQAAVMRVLAGELRERAGVLRAELDEPSLFGSVPDATASMTPIVQTLGTVRARAASLAADLDAFGRADAMPEVARVSANRPARVARDAADAAAVLADGANRLESPPLVDAARALATGETLLVIGPPGTGVTAIAPDAMLPPVDLLDRAGVNAAALIAQRTEALVSAAIDRVLSGPGPVIVLVHGEATDGVIDSPGIAGLRSRLADRGWDIVEWAAAIDGSPPSLASVNPGGTRPVVWVTLATSTLPTRGGDPNLQGPQRAARLGAAIASLVERGEPVLVSLGPSYMPTYGDVDPLVAAIEPFGVTASTGTPLLSADPVAGTNRVRTETSFVGGGSASHPVGDAVRGLAGVFSWAVPVDAGTNGAALVGVEADGRWAETEWVSFWATRRDERPLAGVEPEPSDAERLEGPVTLAVAAERTIEGEIRPARAVVIGSNGWFLDALALQTRVSDGRPGLAAPANTELFFASVSWLAGLEGQIAASPEATATPTIRPLDPDRLTVYRWALIVGLPAGVLVLGLACRVVFG